MSNDSDDLSEGEHMQNVTSTNPGMKNYTVRLK